MLRSGLSVKSTDEIFLFFTGTVGYFSNSIVMWLENWEGKDLKIPTNTYN